MDLTQNELDQLRTAMNAELDRLIAARKPEVKQWPQVGDLVFSITLGNDGVCVYQHHMTSNDFYWHAFGAIFKTRAEAERRVEALKVQAELRRMPGSIDWADARYGIGMNHNSVGFSATRSTLPTASICGVWFSTKSQANYAIKTIGQDRLQIWLDDYLQTPIGGQND